MTIVDRIITLFEEHGQGAYFGEAISEMEHALQCAHLAESAGADRNLIVASLLHDVGHLLHGLPEDIAQRAVDARHEDGGAAWLENHFPREVVDPTRLHVAAKRYLCAIDPTYYDGLSPASQLSLKLQGGPMTADEIQRFEAEPHYQAAVALRRWDDGAKVPNLQVPGIDHYRPMLEAVCREN